MTLDDAHELTSKLPSAYSCLSNCRAELMGLAILWVVWFHSTLHSNLFPRESLNRVLEFVKTTGYGGVDIFLFLSGLGIYNSLDKHRVSKYFLNRVKRLVPAWVGYFAINGIVGAVLFGIACTPKETLGYLTFTGYWLDMANQGNWYVYAIMLFYLISPVLYSLIKDRALGRHTPAVLVAIALLLSLAFFKSGKLMAFSRLPIFIIGMCVSAYAKDWQPTRTHWILAGALLVGGVTLLWVCCRYFNWALWSYGLWWYPFILITPSLSLILAWCFDKCRSKAGALLKLLALFGRSSLEVLLASEFVFSFVKRAKVMVGSDAITACLAILCSLVLGVVAHWRIEWLLQTIDKAQKRKASSVEAGNRATDNSFVGRRTKVRNDLADSIDEVNRDALC